MSLANFPKCQISKLPDDNFFEILQISYETKSDETEQDQTRTDKKYPDPLNFIRKAWWNPSGYSAKSI